MNQVESEHANHGNGAHSAALSEVGIVRSTSLYLVNPAVKIETAYQIAANLDQVANNIASMIRPRFNER